MFCFFKECLPPFGVDLFHLPFFIDKVCTEAEKTVADHQARAAPPGLTPDQFFLLIPKRDNIITYFGFKIARPGSYA